MLNLYRTVPAIIAAATIMVAAHAHAQTRSITPVEAYIQEPLPPGVQVLGTEVDGPVFATAEGRTLYVWPGRGQNDQGYRGEQDGRPMCGDTVQQITAGFHEPYPPGLILPDLEARTSCAAQWPPFYADADAQPVGDWTIVENPNGRKQWAYGGLAAYTSALDQQPGDVIGSGRLHAAGDSGAKRRPIGPNPDVPAQFDVVTVPMGRMLTTIDGFSVYASDRDANNRSACDAMCERSWAPVLAHASAPRSRGDWGVIERSPGVHQWTFRRKPLYTLIGDEQRASFHGSDFAGWRNVFTQPVPEFPRGFTVQDAPGGQILADAKGRTIYSYTCIDDSLDQMICDHPTHTQAYRWAMCGGFDKTGAFDKARCLSNFPYLTAAANERSTSRIWAIKYIDPQTGRYAPENEPGAVRIWTYRDRPLYVFARDSQPGDTYGDSWGENNGWINGYHAFFVREEFRKQYLDTSRSGRR